MTEEHLVVKPPWFPPAPSMLDMHEYMYVQGLEQFLGFCFGPLIAIY